MTVFWLSLTLPVAAWALSYLYLARAHGRANLLRTKIHESGRYTLLQTLLYCNHFLRELFIDSLVALAAYGCIVSIVPSIAGTRAGPAWPIALMGLLVFLAVVGAGSVAQVGWKASLLDLLQFRERDTLVRFGSHWQMHVLSTLALMLGLALPASLGRGSQPPALVGAFVGFVALTILFLPTSRSLTDRRWLLHGGREILTFAVLFEAPVAAYAFSHPAAALGVPTLLTAALGAGLAIILLYLLQTYRTSDLPSLAQQRLPAAYLMASHFFEHVLDIIYMTLLLMLLGSLPA